MRKHPQKIFCKQELIKVVLEKIDFSNKDHRLLFFSASKVEVETIMIEKKPKKVMALYFSQEAYEQLHHFVKYAVRGNRND